MSVVMVIDTNTCCRRQLTLLPRQQRKPSRVKWWRACPKSSSLLWSHPSKDLPKWCSSSFQQLIWVGWRKVSVAADIFMWPEPQTHLVYVLKRQCDSSN